MSDQKFTQTTETSGLFTLEGTGVYPAMIMKAVTLRHHVVLFRGMPHSYKDVLSALIMLVDCNNIYKAIFARRETIAKMSGSSLDVVERALAWLESRGAITREKRAHTVICEDGSKTYAGSASDIFFSQPTLDALQLSLPAPTDLKPGVVTPVIRREVLESGEVKYNRTNLVKVGKVRLPSDLANLVTSGGLTGPAVLKLMVLARKAGQRLSDVLAMCQKRITEIGLSGRSLFVYLKKAATGERRSKADIAKELAAQAEAERVHQAALAAEQAKREAEAAASLATGQANKDKGALIRSLNRTRLEALLADWMGKSPGRAGSNLDNKFFLVSLRGMTEAQLLGQGY